MLRKFLRLSLLVLLLAPFAAAQFTLVTGTVVDPNGVPYALGTITAQLVTAGVTPTINGNSFAMTGSSGLSATGSFTMQLVSNALMLPNTLQWSFQVCSAQGTVQPAGGPGPVCFTTLITISGATQSISSTLSAAALALTITTGGGPVNSAGAVGGFYTDGLLNPPKVAFGTVNLANGTANAVWCEQFTLAASFSINQMTILGEALGTDDVGIGIYSTSGNRLLSATFVAIGTVLATQSTGTAVTLPVGTYYFCWSETSTSAGITYLTINASSFAGSQLSTGAINIKAANTAPLGVMPATLGAPTILNSAFAVIPYVQLNHS